MEEEYFIPIFEEVQCEQVIAVPEAPILTNKYTLLNETHYHALNASISEALGYGVDCPDGTLHYTNPEPELVGEYTVMVITTEVQEKCPELLEGLELIDTLPTLMKYSICSEHQPPVADCPACNKVGYETQG